MSEQSLYDKYGGFATINSIVIQFYDNLLANDDVSHFFENIALENLIDHVLDYFSGKTSNSSITIKEFVKIFTILEKIKLNNV